MVQALMKWEEYEKETGKLYKSYDHDKYSTPTWEYVSWLEKKLAGHEGWIDPATYTVSTAGSGGGWGEKYGGGGGYPHDTPLSKAIIHEDKKETPSQEYGEGTYSV